MTATATFDDLILAIRDWDEHTALTSQCSCGHGLPTESGDAWITEFERHRAFVLVAALMGRGWDVLVGSETDAKDSEILDEVRDRLIAETQQATARKTHIHQTITKLSQHSHFGRADQPCPECHRGGLLHFPECSQYEPPIQLPPWPPVWQQE